MRKKIVLTAVISCFLFGACKKDQVSNHAAPQNDSILLAKVISLDTTVAAPMDTLAIYYFNYDSYKRVVKEKVYNYNGTGAVVNSSTEDDYYNGSDSFCFKAHVDYASAISTDVNTVYYSFSPVTGRLISDSTINDYEAGGTIELDTSIAQYTYFTDSLLVNEYERTNTGLINTEPFSAKLFKQSGNIISQTDTTGGTTLESFSCNYDTHPKPSHLNFWFSNIHLYFYQYFPMYCGWNNNITELNYRRTAISNPSNVETIHYRFDYNYRSDGYPLEILVKDMGSTNPGLVNKVKYFYTN